MAGSDVGFSFQADVVNVGSLAHLITGRALKSLSDGGVDFYSVVVVHMLGKSFVVSSSLEASVHSHIVAKGRTGIQSVLSKALRIGWGHSGLAEDMSRTRAGTNALLLIGALATGSTSFVAAQCLSELLSLYGCRADKLPNLDVLSHMTGYLAPFVQDLGFPKILAHVTTTAARAICLQTPDNTQAAIHLTRHGDAPGVAGTINQLMLTSKKRETVYLITRMRGAWFSTFASHLLGMAVELRLNDSVVWASAGSNGTAIFELGEHQTAESPVPVVSDRKIMLVEPTGPEIEKSVEVFYSVGDAFESLIAQFPAINIELRGAIARSISRVSLSYARNRNKGNYLGNGDFDMYGAHRETLQAFGIDSISEGPTEYLRRGLMNACGKHGDRQSQEDFYKVFGSLVKMHLKCLCGRVNRLIEGFAAAIYALMHCRFDASKLSLRGDVLLGESRKSQLVKLLNNDSGLGTLDGVLSYLMALTCIDDKKIQLQLKLFNDDYRVMGLSGGNHTVYYTGLLQTNCYDQQGRFLSLSPGRASVDGTMRLLLLEGASGWNTDHSQAMDLSTSLGVGSFVEPHYLPSRVSVYLGVRLEEGAIQVRFAVGLEKATADEISLTQCVHYVLSRKFLRCEHKANAQFRVENEHNVKVLGFNPCLARKREDALHMFALRGNKLEQVISTYTIYYRQGKDASELQHFACLKCCIEAALKRPPDFRSVIMGG
ncbi:hypothetical protein GGR52DRAFT_536514 [Hypoxylon sp. FL1284]|nr:hypothetical protein GGR52DRAFT_536514 [Hypoxylon sp. FL1284]